MSDNTTIPGGRYMTEGGIVRDANGKPLEASDERATNRSDVTTNTVEAQGAGDKSKIKSKK